MSDTTASLRRKIGSASDLQVVVRTMKALAGASIGQYERSVLALADYHRTIELGLCACLRQRASAAETVRRRNHGDGEQSSAVVFGSDQGLVGQFNEVVADAAIKAITALPAPVQIWAVGERVHSRLTDAGLDLAPPFAVPTEVRGITALVAEILVTTEQSRTNSGAELYLFYNRPSGGSAYSPVQQRLLPLDDEWRQRLTALPWPTVQLPEVIGDDAAALRALLREYLFISLFRACAESLASENASRLAAMERADKNIDDLLEGFRGTFHRLRQGGIDEELFEVIAGFESLSAAAPGAGR